MNMLQAIPAMPVREMERSVGFYRDLLGFTVRHWEGGFAVLECGGVEVHLWHSGDESWRTREDKRPIISGAESFIAGTASFRIRVEGVDELHSRLTPFGIMHPNTKLGDRPWGVREFDVLDPDSNLITFYERRIS